MKILVAGGGSGEGIAVNNKNKATTYMKMAEIQAGLGFGVKKFQLVWVFDTEKALNEFVNSGWEFGGQATAAAQTGDKGAAYQGASPWRQESGSTRSRTKVWRSSSPPRERSITRTPS